MTHYEPELSQPPKSSGRSDRGSGISVSSQQARSAPPESGESYRSRDSGISVSSQPLSHDRPPSKSVHWHPYKNHSVRYQPGKIIHLEPYDDPHHDALDNIPSTEEGMRKHRATVKDIEDIIRAFPDSESSCSSRNESPSAVYAEEIEKNTEKPPMRRVDGFCHAGDAKDVTVQLSLELHDDLADKIEKLQLLIQLGRFHAAKEHFTKHLESHAHQPYVRVEYAYMFWRQGDFKSLTDLVAQPLRGSEEDDMHLRVGIHLDVGLHRDEHTDAETFQGLYQYWSVLRTCVLAIHDIAQLTETDREGLHAATKALEKALGQPNKAISPNDVRTLFLLIHLHEDYSSIFAEMDLNLNPLIHRVKSFEGWGDFYDDLLRQGRIWDFRDLFCGLARAAGYESALSSILGMPTSTTTETRLATKRLIADWTSTLPEESLSAKLALLSVCTHVPIMVTSLQTDAERPDADYLDEFTPLAHSVLLHHPGALRSRPYLDWIICKVYHTNVQGRENQADFAALLSISPGIFMHDEVLPMYIPYRDENPGWRVPDAKPDFKVAIRMALRVAREIGDCVLQVAALKSLIRISNDPADEFEQLGTLYKLLGHSTGYTQLLASKYLISTTPELREKLKQEVATLLSKPIPLRAVTPDVAWMVKMLYVRLEGSDSLLSRGPLDDACYLLLKDRLSKELQHLITISPFTREDTHCRPVNAGTLGAVPRPSITMGRQASQSSSTDRQLLETGTKSTPMLRRHHVGKGLETFPGYSTTSPESLGRKDRLRRALDIAQAPQSSGSNNERRVKTTAFGRRDSSGYYGSERKRAAPSSHGDLGNHPQEPSRTNHPHLSSLADLCYQENLLTRAMSLLEERQRIAAKEGDVDRDKALAESCSGINRELNRPAPQKHGIPMHSKKPPRPSFNDEEFERPGPVPKDEPCEPSAHGAPPPSGLSPPKPPPTMSPPGELSPPMSSADIRQVKTQERQSGEGHTSAATAADYQQPGQDTSMKDDRQDASPTSDRPSKTSTDEGIIHI